MKTDLFYSCGPYWVLHICWHVEWSSVTSESRSVMPDSLQPHGLYSPWNSPGQNTRVGSMSVLQRIFPTQGSNPGLAHCRQILYQLSYKGSPIILEWVAYAFSRGSSQPRNQTRISCSRKNLYQVSYQRSPWYAKCSMWNGGLDKAQAGIKITRRNISNLCMQIILL